MSSQIQNQGQVLKFGATVLQNLPELPGEIMQGWIENPAALAKNLREALSPPPFEIRVWKTIKFGTGLKTADDFRKALKGNRCGVSDWANDIMSKPDFAQSLAEANPEQEHDLVVLTTAQLTGKGKGTTAEVFAGAKRLKLEKCPAWMGPKLRLDHQDQPNGEWLFIGMEPIADSDGDLLVFRVERLGSGLWLCVSCDDPGHVWSPGFQWVFVRPRK